MADRNHGTILNFNPIILLPLWHYAWQLALWCRPSDCPTVPMFLVGFRVGVEG